MHTAAIDEPPSWFLSVRALDLAAIIGGAIACAVYLALLVTADAPPLVLASAALLAAGLVLSRRFGSWGLLPASTGAVIAILRTDLETPAWIVLLSLIFSLALSGRRLWLAGPVSGLVLYAATVGGDPERYGDPIAYIALTTAIAAAATGYAVREHDRHLRAVRQRALDAIASRDLEVTRRLAEERLRIAQDLHDVVGHEIAVIGMSLGAIDVNLPPEAAARSPLASAQEAVRSVLAETQRILGVLRRGDHDLGGAGVATAAQIPHLVATLRDAGAEVELTMPADGDTLDPVASVTAYRIAQEALTNAHRHGDGGIAVELRRTARELLVVVENDVRAASDVTTPGYGLVGMRERAAAAGGSLRVHAGADRFVVTASLPLEERARS